MHSPTKSSSPADFYEDPQDPLSHFQTFLCFIIESSGSCGPAYFSAFSHKVLESLNTILKIL